MRKQKFAFDSVCYLFKVLQLAALSWKVQKHVNILEMN